MGGGAARRGRHGRLASPELSLVRRRLSGVVDFLDVHIGTNSPSKWDEIEALQARFPERSPHPKKRPRIASEHLPWADLGLVPRWVGEDSSRSIAAIEYGRYSGQGAEDWRRFVAGTSERGELAVFVTTVGELEPEPFTTSIFSGGASAWMPHVDSFWIEGNEISLSEPPRLADELDPADRDLALRIANARPAGLPWWHLRLAVGQRDRDGSPAGFFGTWTPLLLSPAGEVVAGVWTEHEPTDSGNPLVRCYVLPALDSYVPVLRWLAEVGVPELLPASARRMHRYARDLPALQTTAEREILAQIESLNRSYDTQSRELRTRLDAERQSVDGVREPLLFGSGVSLETGVAQVLKDAAVNVQRLDTLVGTTSADLLATFGGRAVLVEVKSSSGSAAESMVDSLRRHLRTWPMVMPGIVVSGGALVVNHQRRTAPVDRSPHVFSRAEFVASLEVPVVSTVALFDSWRRGDMDAVRASIGLSDAYDGGRLGSQGETQAPTRRRRPIWRR